VEVYRGVTEARFAEALRIGDFFVGRGGEVDGMYCAAGPQALAVARRHASGGSGVIVRMTLKRGARIVNWHELERLEVTGIDQMVGRSGGARLLYNDFDRVAAFLGYDAVHIVDFPDIDQFVVLDRTALR
jgi:hypothetical protein